MRYIISIIFGLLIIGCNNLNKKPTILDEKKKRFAKEILNKKENQNIKKEIEIIKLNKEIEAKKIEAKTKLEIEKLKSKRDIEKSKIDLQVKKESLYIKKLSIYIFLFISILILIIIYFIFKKYQENKIALEKERLKFQKELKEKELKVKMAQKLIDAISKGDLTKEQEEKILSLIEHKNILEYKG